jgi:glycosyltransferase involved in cell wall biosynthesis
LLNPHIKDSEINPALPGNRSARRGPKPSWLPTRVPNGNGLNGHHITPALDRLGSLRPRVAGKFIFVGNEKFWVRGVTYGTFRPDAAGNEFADPEIVERDFTQIAANGLNTVRTYTAPPRWFLDAAQQHGLHVMVGIPWEQHITFLDDNQRCRSIVERVRASARALAGHPAILCYAIGNEIPAPIVRWHGAQKVERFLGRLYRAAKAEDPAGLVTYVNYPTTEYLELPFLDLVCFNVYLESKERFEDYLARLHNLAGDRPLILTEIGLDSRHNGEESQAKSVEWQIRGTFASGCAGAFVFAWTDEWHRGGYDIEDWDFGLTTRDRRPKPALAAARNAFSEVPFPPSLQWPLISVVVCSYNGSRTIRDCFDGLTRLSYPNYEVIVINDGSTDSTAKIAREYGFRVISTHNQGLSNARNLGCQAAAGEIVAYIDDDAYPDPHWLTYLAAAFMNTEHAGIGGPNVPPSGNGLIGDCVAHAPGGPVHVLLSDQEAEHIPGCNMAFRKIALEEIDGFDPQFRSAGDDVDVCWRLQKKDYTLGFSPSAMVWHHRRNSLVAYWKQQIGYGKAEALLERKWPEKYNAAGHLTWGGRVYGNGHTHALGKAWRIYYGTWGGAPFQSRYEDPPGLLRSLPLMPEWYLVIAALAWLSVMGIFWRPLLNVLPLLALALAVPLAQAVLSGARASFAEPHRSALARLCLRSLTAWLHLVQPLARLCGRLRYDLTPWRKRGVGGAALPLPRSFMLWSETWLAAADRLHSVEAALRGCGASVVRGGNYDDWDLEARDGVFPAVRMRMTTEEHGGGKQLVRFRVWPIFSTGVVLLVMALLGIAVGAALDRAWIAAGTIASAGLVLFLRMFQDCATVTAAVVRTLKQLGARED